jgi:hypothetical protein
VAAILPDELGALAFIVVGGSQGLAINVCTQAGGLTAQQIARRNCTSKKFRSLPKSGGKEDTRSHHQDGRQIPCASAHYRDGLVGETGKVNFWLADLLPRKSMRVTTVATANNGRKAYRAANRVPANRNCRPKLCSTVFAGPHDRLKWILFGKQNDVIIRTCDWFWDYRVSHAFAASFPCEAVHGFAPLQHAWNRSRNLR